MKTIKATITTAILSLFFAFGAHAQSDTTIGSDTTAIPKDTAETSMNLIQLNDNGDVLAMNIQDTTKSKEVREMEKTSKDKATKTKTRVEEVEVESVPQKMDSKPKGEMKKENAVIEETIIEEQNTTTDSPE